MISELLLQRKSVLLAIVGVILLLIGGVAGFYYLQGTKLSVDPPLQKAFQKVSSTHAYEQAVETHAEFSDRSLAITGIYGVDSENRSYSSYSTTTLTIHGDKIDHVFTHMNIAIGSDVYVKVETNDKILQSSIKNGPEWLHFSSNAIPHDYASIAIPGPIQDNLTLLGDNGAWLTLIKKNGKANIGSTTLLHYEFKLSGKIPGEEGALNAMVSRIGPAGTIDVWIDPTTYQPRYLRFMNKTYVSTTTLTYPGNSLPITAPITTTVKS